MDSTQIIWLVVAIVVVLVIVAVLIVVNRRRKHGQERARVKATNLRQEALDTEITAKEREAEAARARAGALEAEAEAERRRREADEHTEGVQSLRDDVDERRERADRIDPRDQPPT